MLNKNLTDVLGALNSVTNSVILNYPTTILNNSAGDVVVKLNVESLDPDTFDEMGIYDLSEFLSAFRLFDEREVQRNGNALTITGGNSSLNYLCTNVNVLENFNKSPKLFESTENVPSVATFNLEEADMKMIKDAGKVFKDLSDVVITSQDGGLILSLSSSNNFNATSNSFSIRKTGNTTKEFSIKIPAENFNALPNSNYQFEVKYNEARDAYRIILKSTDVDITILMAIKK